MKTKIIKISGMHCASCAIKIEKQFSKKDGVVSASVNYATKKAIINYDPKNIGEKDFDKILIKAGYSSEENDEKNTKDTQKFKIIVILSILFTIPIFIRMFWHWEIPGRFIGISNTGWLQNILAFIVVFILGFRFHKNTIMQLKRLSANMDTLISLGTLSAYFYSLYAMFAGMPLYFETAATITSLILLGKFLEFKTKNRASKAMKKLMELGVKQARVITNNEEKMIDIDLVKIGDIVLIKAGEKVPLDGKIISGQATIDESMLTGESMPVSKQENSSVYAATINKDGILKIQVEKLNNETVLAQIIKTVEQTQEFKAPIQKMADKIAGIFVPVVIGIAFLTFLGWWLIGGSISIGIINAVTVLIISCPCALGIATPIAVMVGSSVGAKNGILIKGGESFEKARFIQCVVFDKTGTLTKGIPKVNETLINDQTNFKKEKIIKIAASLSSKSEHPLSKAVSKLAKEENTEFTPINDFKEVSGKGLMGKCSKHSTQLMIGNITLMKNNNINTTWATQMIDKYKHNGSIILFISHDKNIIGAFLLSDEIKEDAKQAIDTLKQMNLETVIISGDSKHVTKFVSESLGIDKYYAEVLPNQKQEIIKELQKDKKVVFVGDGINDAPALIQSDLGIAMGSGTDIARESGDIIIMNSSPKTVIKAINLSRKTFKTIKQNLFWAFFYNILAIPLAIAGFANPMVGAIAMGLSDVAVISNSLRIYKE